MPFALNDSQSWARRLVTSRTANRLTETYRAMWIVDCERCPLGLYYDTMEGGQWTTTEIKGQMQRRKNKQYTNNTSPQCEILSVRVCDVFKRKQN